MNLQVLEEPELEFGNGGRHIDVRFGMLQSGPLDRGSELPKMIRVGIVGSGETVEGVRRWLERCQTQVAGKQTRQPNLHPSFPGFSQDGCFGASLQFHERWTAVIPNREFESLSGSDDDHPLVYRAVELFLSHAKNCEEMGGPDVVICAPPEGLLAALESPRNPADALDEELDEGSESPSQRSRAPAFHDVLKAEGLVLKAPIQMIRPATYTGAKRPRRGSRRNPDAMMMQDEATRAWNFHTALYYKAGGVPWRLLRQPTDLTTCFVGVSFYRSRTGEQLLTSVAQVFNERGEGTIIKGKLAELDKDDRQAHLPETDAAKLLLEAIEAYRREHHTQPARVVVHKTSRFNAAELAGFKAAATSERIHTVDLLSIRRSHTRLFRIGTYPPLRGSFWELDRDLGIIYLRGSVDFFRTYPGLYVPRPLEYRLEVSDSTVRQIGTELLALSKLNWNNTQFDGGEPITVRAARRVGDILKHVAAEELQANFRYFM